MINGRNKSIAFISRGLGMGGAQKILAYVASVCAENGYDVTIISIASIKPTVALNDDIKVIYLNYLWSDFNELSFLQRRYREIKIIKEVRRQIKKIHPDAICAFIVDIVNLTRIATLGWNIPIISSERDNPYIFGKWQRLTAEYNYYKSDVTIFQTERAMKAFGNRVQKKALIIPNPCIPRISPILPYTGKRRPIIVGAGRFEEVKQFHILIQAFEVVIKKHQEYSLYIYGDGTQRDNLMKMIADSGLSEKVILKGAVDDVFKKISDCAIFVLPSRSEGIPNVLIEALSIGIPCISMDCEPGGPRQLLNDGRRGMLIPVGDTERLADALNYYIENPQVAERFGKLGLEINKELVPSVIGEKWLNAFEKVFEKAGKQGIKGIK